VLLAILLAVSMLSTLLLAVHTLRQAGRERGGLRALLTTFISDRSVFERPTKR
jgi:hypothetical protein